MPKLIKFSLIISTVSECFTQVACCLIKVGFLSEKIPFVNLFTPSQVAALNQTKRSAIYDKHRIISLKKWKVAIGICSFKIITKIVVTFSSLIFA